MTAEEVIAKVRESLNMALREVVGQKVNEQTKSRVKNTIMGMLQRYYETGIIDIIPLIDINHETEIAALTNRIAELREEYTRTGNPSISDEVRNLNWRVGSLKDSLGSPNGLVVSLKDPLTYGPFTWHGTGSYDN